MESNDGLELQVGPFSIKVPLDSLPILYGAVGRACVANKLQQMMVPSKHSELHEAIMELRQAIIKYETGHIGLDKILTHIGSVICLVTISMRDSQAIDLDLIVSGNQAVLSAIRDALADFERIKIDSAQACCLA